MPPMRDSHDLTTWRTDVAHLDGLSTAAFATDAAGNVVHCNAAAETLLGSRREQLLGHELVPVLVPEDHWGGGRQVHAQAMNGVAWSGRLPLNDPESGNRPLDVSATPLRRDRQTVGVLFVIEAADDALEHQGRSQRVAARLARLARVTAELVTAEDMETVTKIVVSQAADVAGATVASLMRLVDEQTIALVGIRGADAAVASQWATFPLSAATPAGDCIRTQRQLVLAGRDEIERRYPGLEMTTPGERTLVSLPLVSGGRSHGAISLSFPGRRAFDSAEQEFLQLLADTCAQAIDRIQALAAAADRASKLAFLSEASAQLASSLDYQATLRNVAWLGVPRFADWCAISLVEDGGLHPLAIAHIDPDKVALAEELQRRYPADRDAAHGEWNVVRTGASELIPVITDELLTAAAQDETHLRLARELNLRSAVSSPLIAHGRVLGVMTWVSADEHRLFSSADLDFVEDLAQRAAVAIDNAQLHSETREAAVRLQRAVLPEELAHADGWTFASYYGASGRTEVGGDFYDVVDLGGRIALFVGDVMGRGVAAAAAMAQIRAAVRSYVALDPTPTSVVRRLDTMFEMYDYSQLVTLVYVLADPARGELVVVNAGHPSPLVLRGDGTTDLLRQAVGAPLGLDRDGRAAFRVPFREQDTLLLYTDGLIERRNEDIDHGAERLVRSSAALTDGDLGASLVRLVEEVRDHTREDDVAALVARRLTEG